MRSGAEVVRYGATSSDGAEVVRCGATSSDRVCTSTLKQLVASLASAPHPWDVMFSCAAGCAAGSCDKQCMLIDHDVNCVHVASSS